MDSHETNFNEKRATWKIQIFYIFLAVFFLIPLTLLKAVNTVIWKQNQAKQLLPFHSTNNKLREVLY